MRVFYKPTKRERHQQDNLSIIPELPYCEKPIYEEAFANFQQVNIGISNSEFENLYLQQNK